MCTFVFVLKTILSVIIEFIFTDKILLLCYPLS